MRLSSERSWNFFKKIIYIQVWEFLCDEFRSQSMIYSIVIDYNTLCLSPLIAGGCDEAAVCCRTLVRRFATTGDHLQQLFREVRITHVRPDSPGSKNFLTRREGTQFFPFSQFPLLCSGLVLRLGCRSLLIFIQDALNCLFHTLLQPLSRV